VVVAVLSIAKIAGIAKIGNLKISFSFNPITCSAKPSAQQPSIWISLAIPAILAILFRSIPLADPY